MKRFFVLLLCLGLCGCGYAFKMNRLSLGMTKSQVIKVMGNPHSTRAAYGTEVLEYRLFPDIVAMQRDNYCVTLKDGNVVKYGKEGFWEVP